MDNSKEVPKSATRSAAAPAGSSAPDYHTKDIGKWQAQQEDPFAKQNQAQAEKLSQQKARRKKYLPFVIAGGSIVALALVIWGVVALVNHLNRLALEKAAADPSIISGSSSQDIYRYQTYLQQVYDENDGDIESVFQAVSATIETTNGKQYINEAILAEMLFLQLNAQYQSAVNRASDINPDDLEVEQKIIYYNILSNCHSLLGNTELAAEYLRIGYEISVARGGEGG